MMGVAMTNADASKNRPVFESILIWDLPTRLFHWGLVLLVIVSYVSGKTGGTAMRFHVWSGYLILFLLLFRLVWGFVGGRHARFVSFLRGPGAVWRYASTFLRRSGSPHVGHNPLGGWSVVAMLALLTVQAVSGLFADDFAATRGPLNHLVGEETGGLFSLVHLLNQQLLLILIGVHLAAVLFHQLILRDNLIAPMFTGWKKIQNPVESPPEKERLTAAFVAALLSAAVVYLLVR
jgi:cytochrome b